MPSRKFSTVEEQSAYQKGVLDSFEERERSMVQGEHYAQLLCSALLAMVDAPLTREGLRLGLYLFAVYPYSEHYFKLPSQGEFALRLGVSRQTINAAQAALEACGVWQFKITEWFGKNTAVRSPSKSAIAKPTLPPEPPFSEPEKPAIAEKSAIAVEPPPQILPPELESQSEPIIPELSVDPSEIAAELPPGPFVWESCEWGQIHPGIDPRFWPRLLDRTQRLSDARVASGAKQIGNPQAYALVMLHNDGARHYRDFEIAIGLREPERVEPRSPGVLFSEGEDWRQGVDFEDLSDLGEPIALIKIYWQELKLSWSDQRLRDWIAAAQQIKPFEVSAQGQGGFYTWPNWAVCKLAYDLRHYSPVQRNGGGS